MNAVKTHIKKTSKSNYLLTGLFVFLFVFCFVGIFIEPVFGRYVNNVVVESETARVGKWSVTADTKPGTDNEVLLSTAQKSDSYKFIVSNKNASGNVNEVLTKYSVAVDFGDNDLPSNVSMSLSYVDGTTKTLSFKKAETGNVYILDGDQPSEWIFTPGAEDSRELSLDFSLTSIYNENGEAGATISNIKVRVYFEQTQ